MSWKREREREKKLKVREKELSEKKRSRDETPSCSGSPFIAVIKESIKARRVDVGNFFPSSPVN